MEKNIINPEILELKNPEFEAVMKTYLAEKTSDHLAAFMEQLKITTFLVPVGFPKDMGPEFLERLKNKEPIRPEEAPAMLPILFNNPQGDLFVPAFTSKEHLPENGGFSVIMPVPFQSILQVALRKENNAKGVLINSNTTKLILNPQLLVAMDRVYKGESVEHVILNPAGGQPQRTEVKMTVEQMHLFIRINAEMGMIPKRAFTEKGAFMEELAERREDVIYDIYRGLYKDGKGCPYTKDEFDVMVLDVNEHMSFASISLPEKNLASGVCTSLYLVWNPQTDDMKYFTVEKTKEENENKLGQVTEDRKHLIIGDAPAAGSEMYHIISMLEDMGEE